MIFASCAVVAFGGQCMQNIPIQMQQELLCRDAMRDRMSAIYDRMSTMQISSPQRQLNHYFGGIYICMFNWINERFGNEVIDENLRNEIKTAACSCHISCDDWINLLSNRVQMEITYSLDEDTLRPGNECDLIIAGAIFGGQVLSLTEMLGGEEQIADHLNVYYFLMLVNGFALSEKRRENLLCTGQKDKKDFEDSSRRETFRKIVKAFIDKHPGIEEMRNCEQLSSEMKQNALSYLEPYFREYGIIK
jgi:hypothetical protein